MGAVPKLPRLIVALGLAALASLGLSVQVLAGGSGISPFPPDGVSPNGQDIRWLYNLISPVALIIFVGVEAALLYAILRYRKGRVGPDYQPPQWHGNTKLEVVWTLIPLGIVLAIAGLSFAVLQKDFTKVSDEQKDMEVVITAHQYGWLYEYKGQYEGLKVDSEGLNSTPLVVPTGKTVRLQTQATDVIHSFWVPDIGGKTDAVPGYSNFTWLKIDQPGEWRGECAELCGTGHYSMQIRVQAVSQSDFDAWVAKQRQAQASPSPSPRPSASVSASASPRPSGSPSASASPSRSP